MITYFYSTLISEDRGPTWDSVGSIELANSNYSRLSALAKLFVFEFAYS